jgi:hypothetical protein
MTLVEAREKLVLWQGAEDAIATGAEYEIGGRRLRRADLAETHRMVLYYRGEVARIQRGGRAGGRVKRIIARDI